MGDTGNSADPDYVLPMPIEIGRAGVQLETLRPEVDASALEAHPMTTTIHNSELTIQAAVQSKGVEVQMHSEPWK